MPRNRQQDEGFSLIEVMFASFLAFFILTALFGLVSASLRESKSAGRETIATNFGNLLIERVRALPYTQVGLQGAVTPDPQGTLPSVETTTYEGIDFTITRSVTWINDPEDNVPPGDPYGADADPYDYKRVDILVSWESASGKPTQVRFQTDIRDKGEEVVNPPTVVYIDPTPSDMSVIFNPGNIAGDAVKWAGDPNNPDGSLGTAYLRARCFDSPDDAPGGYVARLEYWVDGKELKNSGGQYAQWTLTLDQMPYEQAFPGFALDTRATDASGTPLFPDGIRAVKVQAWDNSGARDFRIKQFLVDNNPPVWSNNVITIKRPDVDAAHDSNADRYYGNLFLGWTAATDGSDTTRNYNLERAVNGAAFPATPWLNNAVLGTGPEKKITGLDNYTAYSVRLTPRSPRGLAGATTPATGWRLTNPRLTGRIAGKALYIALNNGIAPSFTAWSPCSIKYDVYKAASYSGAGNLTGIIVKTGTYPTNPAWPNNLLADANSVKGYYYQVRTTITGGSVSGYVWSNVIGPVPASDGALPVPGVTAP